MLTKTVFTSALRLYDGHHRFYLVHRNPRWESWTFPSTKIRENETATEAQHRLFDEFRLNDRPRTRYHRPLPVLQQQLLSPGTKQFTDYRHLGCVENLRAPKRADHRWTPRGCQWVVEEELLAREDVSPTVKALLAPSHLLPPLPPVDDDSLSAQIIRAFHDPERLHAFFDRYHYVLKSTLHSATQMQSADINDFLQEAWLRIWARRDEYVPGTNPLSWILAIAQNLARDTRRTVQRRRLRGEEALEQAPSQGLTPLEAVHRLEDSVRFCRLVRPLSPRDRLIARLHYVEDLSPEEIAECLGRKPGTIHSQLSLIRSRLAQIHGPQVH